MRQLQLEDLLGGTKIVAGPSIPLKISEINDVSFFPDSVVHISAGGFHDFVFKSPYKITAGSEVGLAFRVRPIDKGNLLAMIFGEPEITIGADGITATVRAYVPEKVGIDLKVNSFELLATEAVMFRSLHIPQEIKSPAVQPKKRKPKK